MVVHSLGTFVYAPPECRNGDIILLPEDEAHHLSHVLRVKKNSELYVTDGEGLVHRCVVSGENRLEIEETIPEYGEPPIEITLAVGIVKGDGNRDIVDAATQLGAGRIVFVQAARSEGRLTENKLTRLRRVTVSAIKQCGRARLPKLEVAGSVEVSLKQLPETSGLLVAQQLDDNAGNVEVVKDMTSLTVYVGPEGGFDETELMILREKGAGYLHLGGRRLRTGIAVNAALSYCLRLAGEVR